MEMLQDKKGSMGRGTIENYIMVFVLVLVLFQIIVSLWPLVTASADNLSTSGFPLASFFTSTGVLWYLVSAGILFMVYRAFTGKSK